jgi:hypothetical protein
MDTASEKLRVNPRKASYRNLDRVTTNGDYEITLHLSLGPSPGPRPRTARNALAGVEKRSKVGEQKRSSLDSPVAGSGFEPPVPRGDRLR